MLSARQVRSPGEEAGGTLMWWRCIALSVVVHLVAIVAYDYLQSTALPAMPDYVAPVINLIGAVDQAVEDGIVAYVVPSSVSSEEITPHQAPASTSDASSAGANFDAQLSQEIASTFSYVLALSEPLSGLSSDSEWHSESRPNTSTEPASRAIRVRKLKANSQLNSAEAIYMNRWQAKVESVGSLYMPTQLTKLKGRLVISVQINASGTLRDAQIIEPSPHYELDLASLHILRLAAPFQPFPEELARQYDVLEVVREWDFLGEVTTQPVDF